MALTDRVVMVTGATGELGNAVIAELLKQGARLVLPVRDRARTPSVPTGSAVIEAVDLADVAAVRRLAENARDRFGRFDGLAAIAGGYVGGASIGEEADDLWTRMWQTNVETAATAVRAVLPLLRASDYGRIVLVGARAAVSPGRGTGAYSVSKAAVVALAQAIAAETRGTNVSANVVLPGTLDTAANRAARPKADYSRWVPLGDAARVVAWLLDEPTGLVNGAVLPIYGAS